MKEAMAIIGKALRDARVAGGVTMGTFAKYHGISSSTLCQIERGETEEEYNKRGQLMVDTTITIEAHCHHCQKTFMRHPIIGVVFPAYICDECAKEG